MVHQLNEVLQWWIDLRNDKWAKEIINESNQQIWVSPVHFVNTDWRFQDHRFCREGVDEVDDKNDDTWFYHAPQKLFGNPDQLSNQTYMDLASRRYGFTWRPGRDGYPPLDLTVPVDAPQPPIDPQGPIGGVTTEQKVRTFHPKPAGFKAVEQGILYEFDQAERLERFGTQHIPLQIMCIGDFSAAGDKSDPTAEVRYGFLPYLHAILRRRENFGDRAIAHIFIGTQTTGLTGDLHHEIYPEGRRWSDVTGWTSGTRYFTQTKGKLIPIMMGAKDLERQRNIGEILKDVHELLDKIYDADEQAVVLLASVPVPGDPSDDGSVFSGAQRAAMELNAELAKVVNFHARSKNRKIVYVHLTATHRKRIHDNPWVPSKEGYQRIAFDFLNGILQAHERGFLESPIDISEDKFNVPNYNLKPLVDNEVTNGVKCHQKRAQTDPGIDEITKSLFRGAKDQDDWINNYACNKDYTCTFSWDVIVSFLLDHRRQSSNLSFSGVQHFFVLPI